MSDPKGVRGVPRFDLNVWWWSMVVLGVFIIAFFGFCFCIEPPSANASGLFSGNWRLVWPSDAVHCAAHWRSWEMGAVIWSILFGAYYYGRFPSQSGAAIKTICLLVAAAATIPNILAACFILASMPVVFHVIAVMVGGGLFMLADCLLYRQLDRQLPPSSPNHGGNKRKEIERRRFEIEREKRNYLESLLVADAPMVVGLIILLLYLWAHHGQKESYAEMEAFAGGAISFQLTVANVIFILSQGGFIRWLW